MSRVAVIEDHVLVRDALVREATDAGHDVVAVGTALNSLDGQSVDLILLDLDLADGRADPAVVREWVQRGTAVLVVSALGSPTHVGNMIRAGVAGVVAKQDGLDDLRAAMAAALSGQTWMSPVLARAMASDDRVRPSLSDKELEALQLYACGLKLDTVARRMGVAPSTAKQYIDRVRTKYEQVGRAARTKTELYQEGVRDGFIDPPR